MKLVELKQKAMQLGVQPGRMKKAPLIRAIQQAEGYKPCFEFSGGSCVENNCCFMPDCMKSKQS